MLYSIRKKISFIKDHLFKSIAEMSAFFNKTRSKLILSFVEQKALHELKQPTINTLDNKS